MKTLQTIDACYHPIGITYDAADPPRMGRLLHGIHSRLRRQLAPPRRGVLSSRAARRRHLVAGLAPPSRRPGRDGQGLLRGHDPERTVLRRHRDDAQARGVQGPPARPDGRGGRSSSSPERTLPRVARSSTRRRTPASGAAGSFYCKASYEPLPKGATRGGVSWTSVDEARAEDARPRRAHRALVSLRHACG